jgi:hypothetical protein
MPDAAAVRRLALALPRVQDDSKPERLAFSVHGRGFAWTYMVREQPRKPRRPQLEVLAVRCDLERKEMLIEAAPDRFFDDDHYRGYPAVLVRLEVVDEAELAGLLDQAWRNVAPRGLLRERDG